MAGGCVNAKVTSCFPETISSFYYKGVNVLFTYSLCKWIV